MKKETLDLALVGYGAMGREVEALANRFGCRVTAIFDEDRTIEQRGGDTHFDVAIDFSLPHCVVDNVRLLAARHKNIVIGTTGWYEHLDEVRTLADQWGIGCIYGANFSIGVQAFFRIVRRAAELMNAYGEYDVMLHEMHHRRKVDSPSGTATTLAGIVLEEVERKTALRSDPPAAAIDPAELHVTSTRGGDVPGTHTVSFDSPADTLELTHRARNKSGFAAGALRAAQWIRDKNGLFDFQDIFEEL